MSSVHPLILCYDGSKDAGHAIAQAGGLFPGGYALVLTVWQPISSLAAVTWSGATVMPNFTELDHAASEDGARRAEDGVNLARESGLDAEPLAIELLGSVSATVVHHAHRPTLVIHRPGE